MTCPVCNNPSAAGGPLCGRHVEAWRTSPEIAQAAIDWLARVKRACAHPEARRWLYRGALRSQPGGTPTLEVLEHCQECGTKLGVLTPAQAKARGFELQMLDLSPWDTSTPRPKPSQHARSRS